MFVPLHHVEMTIERTTRRIPRDVLDAAEKLAKARGTTSNEALVLLARRGMQVYAQELEMARHAERHWASILDTTVSAPADLGHDGAGLRGSPWPGSSS